MKGSTMILAATLLCCSIPGNSNAQLDVFRGNKLKRFCDDYKTGTFGLYGATCTGYVNGVADALAYESLFCLSEGVERDQIVLVVKQYLAEHPGELHLQADVLVVRALTGAFPCSGTPAS